MKRVLLLPYLCVLTMSVFAQRTLIFPFYDDVDSLRDTRWQRVFEIAKSEKQEGYVYMVSQSFSDFYTALIISNGKLTFLRIPRFTAKVKQFRLNKIRNEIKELKRGIKIAKKDNLDGKNNTKLQSLEVMLSKKEKELKECNVKVPKIERRTITKTGEVTSWLSNLIFLAGTTADENYEDLVLDGTMYYFVPTKGFSPMSFYAHSPKDGTPASRFVNIVGRVMEMIATTGQIDESELYPEIKKCYKELLTFPQNNSALRIYYLNTFDNK